MPTSNYNEAREFLESLLQSGNNAVMASDYKTALHYYSKGVESFLQMQEIKELWPVYQKLWSNKAMIHQQMKDHLSMDEAAMVANALLDKINKQKESTDH